ncbi:MAG: EAL domain-containing protein [Alteromonadaceae bacterium]|nr:EAL domain-containing protein [Alteromonadaceae bacterium]
MSYCYLGHLSLIKRLFAGLAASLGLLSFPAFAALPVFSFVEFNIAFVLGLSLPVLIIAALMKPVVEIKWRFPALITLSLLSMLYAIAYLHAYQVIVLLSSGMIFMTLLYLWPFSKTNDRRDSLSEHRFLSSTAKKFSNLGISSCAIVFLVLLWFFPKVDAYNSWALCSFVILLIAALHLVLFSFNQIRKRENQQDHKNTEIYRLVIQWLVSLTYVVAMFLWLNTTIDIVWLVIACVLSYLVTLINGSWFLVQRVLAVLPIKVEDEKISIEDLFSFTHDPATNLPSYQQAMIRFEQLVKSSEKKKYAAIVFKSVNFQQVNAVLGHHNSDILLLQLAYCLQRKVVDKDSLVNFDVEKQPIRLARLHGLHFLVVVDLTASHHPEKIVINDLCQQLSAAVPDAMSFKSFSLNFKLIFGAAIFGEHGDNVSEVIAHAGDALLLTETEQQFLTYFDNSSVLYTEQQLLLMECLKQDIQDENLYWYIQPQISLSDRKITGFELKVHWYHGGKPQELHEFVQLAEHSGEVYLLTKHMIKQAFKVLSTLNELGLSLPVSLKLSSKNLLESDLVDFIEMQMKHHNISAKYFLIELTETVIAEAGDRVNAIIAQLKSLEIGIVIDNFSGSYEVLRYLRKMSFEQVKIDCSQLGNSVENSADKIIIDTLVHLTRSMQIPLVGTRVDSNTILRAFESLGGECAQGNTIHRGVVPDEIEIWLEKWFEQYPDSQPRV